VTELQQGGDIRRVTLGQLASHTSGLHRVPQQYEPSHRGPYSLPDFIRYLNAWKADDGHEPGKQDIYSNTGFVLLQLALQRRFDMPYAKLLQQRLLAPLGMTSTAMPVPRPNARGQIAPALRQRAVQGYAVDGQPVGEPGNEQGTFNWPGTGQMYSSARDLAVFLAANLGALPDNRALQDAMALAQQGVFTVNPRFTQALGWQRAQRRSHHRRQERRPQQHLDLYRHDPAEAARHRHPRQPRQGTRHPPRPPDHARARAQQRRRQRRRPQPELSAARPAAAAAPSPPRHVRAAGILSFVGRQIHRLRG
jgi:CubicO group peptidase (beta-lactamase class C family)